MVVLLFKNPLNTFSDNLKSVSNRLSLLFQFFLKLLFSFFHLLFHLFFSFYHLLFFFFHLLLKLFYPLSLLLVSVLVHLDWNEIRLLRWRGFQVLSLNLLSKKRLPVHGLLHFRISNTYKILKKHSNLLGIKWERVAHTESMRDFEFKQLNTSNHSCLVVPLLTSCILSFL